MSIYENDIPILRSEPGFWRTVCSNISRAVKAMQYSRMMSAMATLTDEQLAQAGIERKDIPARAHESIYNTPFIAREKE